MMIDTLIASKTRIKLLLKFFLNNRNTSYLRNLEDEFGESTNGIRVELNRFEKAGFLDSFSEGNKKIFKANTKHPLYSEINKILLKVTGIEDIVDYVLQRLGDLDQVYLVGKLSRGIDTGMIDLVMIGKNLNKPFLVEQIEKVERKIDKKVRYVIYNPEEFSVEKIEETDMHPLLIWKR